MAQQDPPFPASGAPPARGAATPAPPAPPSLPPRRMIPHPVPLLRRLVPALSLLVVATGCSRSSGSAEVAEAETPADRTALFTKLPSSATGVRFENRLTESADLNVFTYRNFYNGGGVAIGDLDGDGLPEVLLTANEGGPRLYLN